MSDSWIQLLQAIGVTTAWLTAAGFFSSVYASLVVTQDAGLQRLKEKFPNALRRIERCGNRWDLIRYAVFLSAAFCALAGLATGFYFLPVDRGPWYLGAFVLVAPVLLSILLKIVPRVLSESHADLISIRFLPFANVLSRVLWPLAWPLARLELGLMNWMMEEADEENRPSSEDEILHLVDQAPDEELEIEEREIIKSVFEFGETVARESMTPRVDMIGLESEATVAEASAAIKDSPYSRFPVYRENIDTIQGMVHLKDLIRLSSEGQGLDPVGEIVKDVISVPESLPISDLLKLFRLGKEQIAIVVDEYGGTAGLITMEDVLEELVGEIHDEHDTEALVMQRLPNGSAIVDARIAVDEAKKLLNIEFPFNDEYESLGGMIYHQLGRIPRPGESVKLPDAILTIQSASERRVLTIRIDKRPVSEKAS
jgi:CBS domain containing-hemolysin-like protein